jgi:[protein-PII] uridylyltransferase
MTEELASQIDRLAERRRALLERLRERPSGQSWCEEHSDLADEAVALMYRNLAATYPDLPPLALIATGGYGRRELAPHSDIDITVVPLDEASPQLDPAIRELFRDLHSAFGSILKLDVGYAYRLISDAPGLDDTTRTGLLDMRLIAGSLEVFNTLSEALVESFAAGEFIVSKTTERDAMFRRYHDTPLVVEPQLKEGAGGLRCFQCSNWIREAIGERPARAGHEVDRILMYRNLLHLSAGRHQDLLTRQRQEHIAKLLHADPFEMMSDVVGAGVALHAEFRRTQEKIREARFSLSRGVLSIRGEVRLLGRPDLGDAAVGVAVATRLGLDVPDLPLIAGDHLMGPAALYAVSRGEPTLRNLDRCGLLGQMLPELDRCRTVVPTDPVHTYTVFEHTLRVVRNLDGISQDPFLAEVQGGLRDLEPLYLAALLHDVGKVDDSRPHSETGAEVAAELCARWGLAENVAETVVWLVREHLSMSQVIGFRDISNPRTTEEFAALVQDVDRLGLLTLLTWADARAVSDTTWTPAQDTFLKELYARTAAHLQGNAPTAPDPAVYRQRLLRQLRGQEQSDESVREFVENLPPHYLTSTPPDVIQLHMEFAKKAAEGHPTVELFHRPEISASEVTVAAKDEPGLLSKLLGVFYAYDLSVLAIRVSTTGTEPPVALDVFSLSFGGRPVPPATSKQVSGSVIDVLEGRQSVEELLGRRGKDPSRKQNIFTYAYHEGAPGILEIRAPRGRGMPYRFSRLIAAQRWNIVAARVGQWAGNAAASFYLLGSDGGCLPKEEVDRVLKNL